MPIRNSKFLKLLTFQMPKFPLVKNLRVKNSLDFPFLCTCRVTLTELQSRNSLTTELHTLSVPPASFTRASLFRLGAWLSLLSLWTRRSHRPPGTAGWPACELETGDRRRARELNPNSTRRASTAHPCCSQCPLSYT